MYEKSWILLRSRLIVGSSNVWWRVKPTCWLTLFRSAYFIFFLYKNSYRSNFWHICKPYVVLQITTLRKIWRQKPTKTKNPTTSLCKVGYTWNYQEVFTCLVFTSRLSLLGTSPYSKLQRESKLKMQKNWTFKIEDEWNSRKSGLS